MVAELPEDVAGRAAWLKALQNEDLGEAAVREAAFSCLLDERVVGALESNDPFASFFGQPLIEVTVASTARERLLALRPAPETDPAELAVLVERAPAGVDVLTRWLAQVRWRSPVAAAMQLGGALAAADASMTEVLASVGPEPLEALIHTTLAGPLRLRLLNELLNNEATRERTLALAEGRAVQPGLTEGEAAQLGALCLAWRSPHHLQVLETLAGQYAWLLGLAGLARPELGRAFEGWLVEGALSGAQAQRIAESAVALPDAEGWPLEAFVTAALAVARAEGRVALTEAVLALVHGWHAAERLAEPLQALAAEAEDELAWAAIRLLLDPSPAAVSAELLVLRLAARPLHDQLDEATLVKLGGHFGDVPSVVSAVAAHLLERPADTGRFARFFDRVLVAEALIPALSGWCTWAEQQPVRTRPMKGGLVREWREGVSPTALLGVARETGDAALHERVEALLELVRPV